MAGAGNAVVFDAQLGGRPIALLGIESRPLERQGPVPADGPERWTAGTLFPCSSKKLARGINAASGRRPLVVLANLSGFDGSPESLRERQLGDRPGGGRLPGSDRVVRGLPPPRWGVRGVLQDAQRLDAGDRGRGARVGHRGRSRRRGGVQRRGRRPHRPGSSGPGGPPAPRRRRRARPRRHESRRRKQPSQTTRIEACQPDPPGFCQFPVQQAGDEVPGHHEGDINTDVSPGDGRQIHVVEHDQDDRDGPQAFDVRPEIGPR